MRTVLFFILLLSASLAHAQRELTTIPVVYATPEQLAAVIKPYLSEGSSVSVYQNQLVLNVTREELDKTRELLERIDVAGRQLLVSVRTDGTGSDSVNASMPRAVRVPVACMLVNSMPCPARRSRLGVLT